MKRFSVRHLLAAIALFTLGIASTLVAQTVTESTQRVEKQRVDLAGAPAMEVVVSTGEYHPGEAIDLHSHHGIEALYVVQGATVQVPGNEPNKLPTGATKVNLRDIDHAGFTVVGDTSLKLFTVHVVDKHKSLYVYAK